MNKTWKILLGLLLIFVAVFGVLDAMNAAFLDPVKEILGVFSFWQIAGGVSFLWLLISSLIRTHFFEATMHAAFLFMIFERNIAYFAGFENENLINNWLLFGLAILFGMGLTLILPKRRHRLAKKMSKKISEKACGRSHSFASNTVYIDCSTFHEHYQYNNMGSTTICFENAEEYSGGGLLNVENNMGSMVIIIPADWKLDCQIENNIGAIKNECGIGGKGPSLTVTGENNMGSVLIKRA